MRGANTKLVPFPPQRFEEDTEVEDSPPAELERDVGPAKTVKATLVSAFLKLRSRMGWDVSLVPSCPANGESWVCTKTEMVGGSMGVVIGARGLSSPHPSG